MAGTIRTLSALDALLDDNTSGDIGFQDAKDLLHSVYNAGRQAHYVPAAAWEPTITNGCSTHAKYEGTADQPNITVLDFAAGADEACQYEIALGDSWDLLTVSFEVYWTSATATSGNVIWGLQGVSISNDQVFDIAYGTAQTVTDSPTVTVYEIYRSSESSAITIGNTPADGDLSFFRLYRNGANASDTMTGDARFIGAKIFFTTDAPNDL